MKLKALIIDDTRIARSELKYLLAKYESIEVIGEASNASEGKISINELNPDVIFLDIQMPGKNGFELLEELDEVPEIIFTTAYNEYAMKAFEINALDYLQKPISEERLDTAIEKVVERLITKPAIISKRILKEDSKVFVKDGEKCWFVTLRDIKLFEIWDNYTRIYFNNEKPMIPKTLNYMENRLDPESFFRVNRQQIINLKWIERVEPWFSGSIRVYLKDGTEVDVSRRQSAKFKELMSF